jgi:uncharacterized protein (TIGR00255 family)
MTGYGSGTAKVPGARITVEVRSVNQRFLDVNLKGPREYITLEGRLVKLVRQTLRRGKVDIFVNKNLDADDPSAVRVDQTLAQGYHAALSQLAELLDYSEPPSLDLVASQRGVLVVGALTPDPDVDAEGVEAATRDALEAMVKMREEEGARLGENLLENARKLRELTVQLDQRAPELVEEFRANLRERLEKLLGDTKLDESRLTQEVALLGERTDIHEEIVRLQSHLDQLEQIVTGGGEMGRRLDFLLQEVHREINTSGSKASDPEVSRLVVDMKSIAERIREQTQNVE